MIVKPVGLLFPLYDSSAPAQHERNVLVKGNREHGGSALTDTPMFERCRHDCEASLNWKKHRVKGKGVR